jgi:hypothetical protein
MKKIIFVLIAVIFVVSSVYAAGTHTFGPQDLADNATAVTGTNAVKAVTPAALTARLRAPGPIGGTTPDAGAFSTLSASGTVSGNGFTAYMASPPTIGTTTPAIGAFTSVSASSPRPTAGSGTGITAGDAGSLRTQVYKITLAKENFLTNGVTHDVTIATFPAKTIFHRVLANVTEAFICADNCTTSTLSATLGLTAGGVEFLESFDLDAAIAVFGDADAEIGSAMDAASNTPGGYVNWAGTTMVMRATSGTGAWGNAVNTHLSAGSVTFYVLYSILP